MKVPRDMVRHFGSSAVTADRPTTQELMDKNNKVLFLPPKGSNDALSGLAKRSAWYVLKPCKRGGRNRYEFSGTRGMADYGHAEARIFVD